MNILLRKFFVSLLALFILSGCQAPPELKSPADVQEESLPTPSVKGPTSEPHVKGPTSAPPGSSSVDTENPQAMTETETVEYSLPTTDAGFKN